MAIEEILIREWSGDVLECASRALKPWCRVHRETGKIVWLRTPPTEYRCVFDKLAVALAQQFGVRDDGYVDEVMAGALVTVVDAVNGQHR